MYAAVDVGAKKLPAPGTLPELLLTLTALSGEFPVSAVRRLSGSKSYMEQVVKQLKKEGLLRTYYRDSLRGLRLTAAAKKLLLDSYPDRFISFFSGDTATNAPKYSVTHRLRLHRMAEVLMAMYNADVLVFPWEKAAVFQPAPSPDRQYIPLPAYYSAREIREIKGVSQEGKKITSSRMTGILFSDAGIFIAYNTGPYQMAWRHNAEMRLSSMLQNEIYQGRLPEQFMDVPVSGIVFASDMERLDTMMDLGNGLPGCPFILDGSFKHFYFLPNNQEGETILRLLCDGQAWAALDAILSQGLLPPDPNFPIENDGLDGKTPVLFGYLCDMPRLRRFINGLAVHNRKGQVYCFDFQEEVYRRCLGPHVQLQCLDLSACERSVFPSTESN